MPWGAAIAGAAVIGGAVISSRGAEDAANVQAEATEAGIAEQREARLAFEQRIQPFLDIGLEAGEQLQSLLADPSQQLEQINPVVSFLRDQGFEQIQESAAASGRLGAGGTLQDLTRFNTQLASTVAPQLQNQRFNQLFNVLGLGQNAAVGSGTAGLQTASNIGNLLQSGGAAQAAGIVGQAGAQQGAIQGLAGVAGAFPNLFGSGGQQTGTLGQSTGTFGPSGEVSGGNQLGAQTTFASPTGTF